MLVVHLVLVVSFITLRPHILVVFVKGVEFEHYFGRSDFNSCNFFIRVTFAFFAFAFSIFLGFFFGALAFVLFFCLLLFFSFLLLFLFRRKGFRCFFALMVLFNFIGGLAVVFFFVLLNPILTRSYLLFHDIVLLYIQDLFLHCLFLSFKLMHSLIASFSAIFLRLFLESNWVIWIA